MLHATTCAAALRRGLRRIAASLLVLLATCAVVQAAPIFAVGPKETIYTKSQRDSLGLPFWTDGSMGVVPLGGGYYDFYAANSTQSVRTTGTLANPGGSKQNVNIWGATGFDYLAGGPVYNDWASGKRLMIYHGERHGNGAQDFYSVLGMAVSTDSSGLNFQDLGVIVQTNVSQAAKPHAIEVGGGSFAVVGDQLHVYYRDYLAAGGSAEFAVARAPLSTVLNNARNFQGTAFNKYYNGSWSQPGVGGLASPLEIGNPYNMWSSVSSNDYTGGLVMASTQYESGGGDLYLSTSNDGVSWTPRQAIAQDPGEQMYPTLIGTGADPTKTGKSFYVYYTDSAAGAWNRWTDAKLTRREITFDPAPPSLPPASNEWTSVGSYAAEYQGGAPAAGWRYMWNPKGTVGNAAAYVPLLWSNVAGAYNTTGGATQAWANGKSHNDDYLALYSWGGHPGRPGYNAIASYTIQPEDGAGLYRLAQASIQKTDGVTSSGEDPLNLLVFVNNTQMGGVQSVATSGAALRFGRDLGQLAVGDTVYVMASAAGNQSYDSFMGFDFAIQKQSLSTTPVVIPPAPIPPTPPPPPVVNPPVTPPPVTPPVTPPQATQWVNVANHLNDFRAGAPLAGSGWNYMWNPTGKVGNAAAFAPLKWSDVAGAYNTTGAATPAWNGAAHVDDYLTIGYYGGHPGQPGYNAIISYTIQADDGAGMYRLAASTLMKADAIKTGNEDGLTLAVYVNNALRGSALTVPTTGAGINFDRELGQLAVGDVIYLIIGAGANQNYDSFKNLNFTIQKLTAVAVAAMAQSVPEPGTSALLACGALSIMAARRRKR